MSSVVQRIKEVTQPRGGYIPPKLLQAGEFDDGHRLSPDENIHASLVGSAVDYLARLARGTDPEEAFKISLLGAERLDDLPRAIRLLDGITGLDHRSVTDACQLTGYDTVTRGHPEFFRPLETIQPNQATTGNIALMVARCLRFFDEYGPIVLDGFTFAGGYTDVVDSGDGDFLSTDTLWDLKVSVRPPKKEHTLQVLMYWLMGRESIHTEFDGITGLGILNPRLNTAFRIAVPEIPAGVLDEVSRVVIGYR